MYIDHRIQRLAPPPNSRVRRIRQASSVQFLLGHLLLIAGLLPWVNFGTNELDTQPWTLLVCLVYLATTGASIRSDRPIRLFVFSILAGLLSVIIFQSTNNLFLNARGIAGHLTIALTVLLFYDFSTRFSFPIRSVVVVNILYLFFAVLDRFNPSYSAAISASRTTAGRGVTSLAAEPSFLAITLFFLTWIILAGNKYKINKKLQALCAVNVLAIIFLAKSALGIVMIATAVSAASLLVLFKMKIKYAIGFTAAFLLIILTFMVFGDQLQGSRLFYIIDFVRNQSISNFLTTDASANTRLQSMVFPIMAAFNNWFLPGGFEGFGGDLRELRADYRLLFLIRGEGNIISSWVGALLFELGVFGICALAVILFSHTGMRREYLVERAALIAVCIHAIPTNFPPMAILFVLLLRRSKYSSGQPSALPKRGAACGP